MTNDDEYFFLCYYVHVCTFLSKMFSSTLFSNWVIYFLIVMLREFLMYSGCKSLISCNLKYSPTLGTVFSLPWWCHLYRKSSSFWWSLIYAFFFVTCAFDKTSPNARLQTVTSVISSQSFTVVAPTFGSTVDFGLMFCVWCKERSTLILLHMNIELSECCVLERLFSLPWTVLTPVLETSPTSAGLPGLFCWFMSPSLRQFHPVLTTEAL